MSQLRMVVQAEGMAGRPCAKLIGADSDFKALAIFQERTLLTTPDFIVSGVDRAKVLEEAKAEADRRGIMGIEWGIFATQAV